jgi:putative N6-adenine-specific DNA methylase
MLDQTTIEALVPCRAGLERVVAAELEGLGINAPRIGRRAVFFVTDWAGIYRANMGLRSALNVLIPLRTFNARNYDMLYYQSRKTNWHKLFTVDKSVRIDVNGGSDVLTHSAYVVHRVKDGMVDTFRKLSGGVRPSISKDAPDIHVVVHLDGTSVTLSLDTSGLPLFKRGYRQEHGVAPLKEDLAAGILQMAGWDGRTPLIDPTSGSGTFLFEGWMLAANIAPNLERRFSFESLLNYDQTLHRAEQQALRAAARPADHCPLIIGLEADAKTHDVAKRIAARHFPRTTIQLHLADFRQWPGDARAAFVISNPPYGIRLGDEAESIALHRDLGTFIRDRSSGNGAVFSANPAALAAMRIRPTRSYTLFNGAIEGRLDLVAATQAAAGA